MKGGPLRIAMIALAMLAVAGLSLAIMLGFLGRVHPGFDSLSHFRIHFAAALLAPGLLLATIAQRRERRVGMLAMAFACAVTLATVGTPMGGPVAPAAASPGDLARYRLLHLNLRFDNEDQAAFLSLIANEQPDVITLAEVSRPWAERLELTRHGYPYRIICQRGIHIGGTAILSRRPFAGAEPMCLDRGSMARATVDFGGTAVEIAALHFGWPWPFDDGRQMRTIGPELASLGPHAILGGDFNAVWWSARVRGMAALGGLELAGRGGPTWLHRRLPHALQPWIGLPIDHVMTKGGVVTLGLRRGAYAGSDHLPMVFDFALLPEAPPPSVMTAGL